MLSSGRESFLSSRSCIAGDRGQASLFFEGLPRCACEPLALSRSISFRTLGGTMEVMQSGMLRKEHHARVVKGVVSASVF